MSVERYRTGLIVGVAVLAVVLAGIGVFSVTARVVAGRSREFGVRVALGAERRRLVWDVVGQHVPGSIGGVVLGLVLARAGGRLIAAFLFGVEPADAPTFILVALVMSVLALVATYLPVLRGTRLDPAAVLRPE
jgi:ABC-type antimicrobial peptide transport system permease subunit